MNADTVIAQFDRLPPDEKRKFRSRLSERPPGDSPPAADFDELVAEGLLKKRNGFWVISPGADMSFPADILEDDRERRIRELMGGVE